MGQIIYYGPWETGVRGLGLGFPGEKIRNEGVPRNEVHHGGATQ